ncbi:DUF4244 domain-containing protein [Streptomyces sp. NPDC091377]|uniref:DUF4244 domain-containing protein n=1 Tax=Streptomyces sp. NPDC091377 TaxID=3365995 RepID=UPI0037FCF99C
MCGMMRTRVRVLVCRARAALRGERRDAGMVTSEYALGIVAAAGLAVVLYRVLTSEQVSAKLRALVERALDAGM